MPEMQLDPEDNYFAAIWEKCKPYTMTSFERGLALSRSIRYIIQNFIAGDFVECGVWRGGSSMIAMLTLQHFGVTDRKFWLFDTFEGMTPPGPLDIDLYGQTARALLDAAEPARDTELIWAYASLQEVKDAVQLTGYDPALIKYVKGDIRQTALDIAIDKIALLRLDTDFYDSTLVELQTYYPRLADGGVLLIDDFGRWQGARRAVDEYFDGLRKVGCVRPYFHVIDYTGRIALKTPAGAALTGPRTDYMAPGLRRSGLLSKFPSLLVRDPEPINWPYLRKAAPHIWRSDARSRRLPDTGVLSFEEAELLYNNALQFAGLRGLEVGCHYGWSTAHLLAAGLDLDVVDPALQHADQHADVTSSLRSSVPDGVFRLWPAYSPAMLPAVHAAENASWSFVFIDGYHEGDAPRMDAEMVADLCSQTCCVMLHDLTSPFVAAGLRAFAARGWNTAIYNTMQIMGIAWRGDTSPVSHVMDPRVPPPSAHLSGFDCLSTA